MPHCTACTTSYFANFVAVTENSKELGSFGFDDVLLPCKACCKHVVKVARDEVDRNPGASQAMREFANIRDADTELGTRRIFVKFGLAAPLDISWLPLGQDNALKQLPWIKLSTWIGHLLDLGALPRQFVGVSSFTKMQGVLKEFWKRHKATDAGHPLFALERDGVVTLDRVVPVFTHSDEGRTFRDLPLWVLNVHGVMIGRGTISWLKAGQPKASGNQRTRIELRRKHMGHPLLNNYDAQRGLHTRSHLHCFSCFCRGCCTLAAPWHHGHQWFWPTCLDLPPCCKRRSPSAG